MCYGFFSFIQANTWEMAENNIVKNEGPKGVQDWLKGSLRSSSSDADRRRLAEITLLYVYLSSVLLLKVIWILFQKKSVIHAYEVSYLERDGHLLLCIDISVSVIIWENEDETLDLLM